MEIGGDIEGQALHLPPGRRHFVSLSTSVNEGIKISLTRARPS
jgi:hypothetical protein